MIDSNVIKYSCCSLDLNLVRTDVEISIEPSRDAIRILKLRPLAFIGELVILKRCFAPTPVGKTKCVMRRVSRPTMATHIEILKSSNDLFFRVWIWSYVHVWHLNSFYHHKFPWLTHGSHSYRTLPVFRMSTCVSPRNMHSLKKWPIRRRKNTGMAKVLSFWDVLCPKQPSCFVHVFASSPQAQPVQSQRQADSRLLNGGRRILFAPKCSAPHNFQMFSNTCRKSYPHPA